VVGRTKTKPAATLTVHQVVAFNFRRAREEQGWTQTQTGEALEPFIGYRLNQAGVSAIEKTFDSDRRRNIDVAEVMAFARCFDKPVGWFFLPPEGHVEPAYAPGVGNAFNLPAANLVTHALGSPAGWQSTVDRLSELLRDRAIAKTIENSLTDRRESYEEQIDLRRRALRDVTVQRLMDPTDEAISQLIGAFVELARLTPQGMLRLRDSDPIEALEVLARGDDLTANLQRMAEEKRARGEQSRGGFDDLRPINRREVLGLDPEE
jgi:hypothetical protein